MTDELEPSRRWSFGIRPKAEWSSGSVSRAGVNVVGRFKVQAPYVSKSTNTANVARLCTAQCLQSTKAWCF